LGLILTAAPQLVERSRPMSNGSKSDGPDGTGESSM
jgi:hypothetical protein